MILLIPCPDCSGFGTVTIACDTGTIGSGYLYEETCPTCDGAAEVEAQCLCCEGPLDEHGWCRECDDFGLTEVHGDPLLVRRAA